MSYKTNKRDSNEAEIIDFLRRAGCITIQMTKDAGFDMVVISPRTGTHIVEVKNPAKKWTLTTAEKALQFQVTQIGGRYNVIENIEQAAILAGV
jgi:hypothetical protein